MTATVNNIYMTRELSLNKSGSKHLWLALHLPTDGSAKPFMALVGDKNVVRLTTENWTALKSKKDVIMRFLAKKQPTLSISMSSDADDTFWTGKIGKSPMIHVSQIKRGDESEQYLYFGGVTIEKLFGLQDYVDYFLETLTDALPEILEYLRQLGEGADSKSLKTRTENGVDLRMLAAEIAEYPRC
jgi:hypothetical protein